MHQSFVSSVTNRKTLIPILISVLIVGVIPIVTSTSLLIGMMVLGVCLLIFAGIALFHKPIISVYYLVAFCFLIFFFSREIGGDIPYGLGIEALLFVALIVLILHADLDDWRRTNSVLTWLMLGWLIISVLEVANPAGASVRGWFQEIRSAAVYPFLIVLVGFLAFRKAADLDTFLIVILVFSLLATLNGVKQLHVGLSSGEQQFLDDGGAITHVLFGKLRVFSFYSDAGQFGASQAHFCMLAAVLALGNFKLWKRLLLALFAVVFFYGMLISGTRGALFALVIAAFFALFLSKNLKVLILGSLLVVAGIGFLKYTTIGNGNYEIYRLRTALDPEDPSLNVRFQNQQRLSVFMSSLPFGGGLGVIGANGQEYNADKFLSTVEPDSYWVKVWAMYGIVGFTLWFSGMMYLLGRGAAIVWKIRSERLRVKCIALLSGVAGIFFCSYGNEVINTMPSLIVTNLSLVFVFLAPSFDRELNTE